MFKCELSDLCDLVHGNVLIHVMRIATGKTNGLKILYGRCIRHKNVNLCAIGALGLYLLARFHQTSEADGIQFKNNKKWFSIKLLIDSCGSDNTKAVSDQAYYSSMKDACKNLGITSKHFVHFGRGAGSVKAELDELDGFNIADLGNWNVDTRRDIYSAKLPMKAMRVMAGHAESKGSVFLPRAQVEPPPELQSQIFPFVDSAIRHVNANHHRTATAFLNMLLQLQVVVLQDAAAVLLSGRKHCLFDLPVFQCPAFEDFLNLIKIHQNSMLDPSDVTLEQILPGVCNRFSNLHSDMSSHFTQIHESVSGLVKPDDLQGFLNHVSGYNFNRLSRATEDATAASTPKIGSNAPVSQYELYKSHRTATSVEQVVWHTPL